MIPIPLSIFRWDSSTMTLTLNVDAQAIDNTPSFQKGQYPATQSPGWDTDIQAYWQN